MNMEYTVFFIVIIALLMVVIFLLIKIRYDSIKSFRKPSNIERNGDFRDIRRLRGYIEYLEKVNKELEHALGTFSKRIFTD